MSGDRRPVTLEPAKLPDFADSRHLLVKSFGLYNVRFFIASMEGGGNYECQPHKLDMVEFRVKRPLGKQR